jgi:hypothetical protein
METHAINASRPGCYMPKSCQDIDQLAFRRIASTDSGSGRVGTGRCQPTLLYLEEDVRPWPQIFSQYLQYPAITKEPGTDGQVIRSHVCCALR